MAYNTVEKTEKYTEIDLGEFFRAILHRWYIVVLAAVVLFAGVYAWNYFQPDKYTATAKIYVLNKQNEDTVTYSDLTGSALLANDYKELITSRKISDMVCQELGLRNLKNYTITVKDVTNTRFINLSVEGLEPTSVALVANSLANAFAETAKGVMNVENIEIIDEAQTPEEPSGPSRMKNALIGAVIGFVLAALIIGLIGALNRTLKTASDIETQLQLPVFARVPMLDNGKKSLKGSAKV